MQRNKLYFFAISQYTENRLLLEFDEINKSIIEYYLYKHCKVINKIQNKNKKISNWIYTYLELLEECIYNLITNVEEEKPFNKNINIAKIVNSEKYINFQLPHTPLFLLF